MIVDGWYCRVEMKRRSWFRELHVQMKREAQSLGVGPRTTVGQISLGAILPCSPKRSKHLCSHRHFFYILHMVTHIHRINSFSSTLCWQAPRFLFASGYAFRYINSKIPKPTPLSSMAAVTDPASQSQATMKLENVRFASAHLNPID